MKGLTVDSKSPPALITAQTTEVASLLYTDYSFSIPKLRIFRLVKTQYQDLHSIELYNNLIMPKW
jgi:hypothetical protein